MKPLDQCRLYAFIDAAYLEGRPPSALAEALACGGADLAQLRAKGWALPEIKRLAEQITPPLQAAGVGLVINDFPELAQDLGAPLVHVGQEDFGRIGGARLMELRRNGRLRFGLSTHAPEQAQRAIAAGADYIAVGPVFATATKPSAPPTTLDYVRWAAAHVSIPWFAIGGITLKNLPSLLEAGARRVAVVSAILKAPDPAQACQSFRQALFSLPL